MTTDSKKVAIVTSSLPNTFHGGGSLTAWSIIQAFLYSDYEVHLLSWNYFDKDIEKKISKEFIELGIKLHFLKKISNKKIKKVFNLYKGFFPHLSARKEVKGTLDRIKPSFVIAYHWEALASTYKINNFSKVGVVGDPINLPYLYRKILAEQLEGRVSFFQFLKNSLLAKQSSKQKKIMIKLLNNCNISGAFANHHVQMFKSWGVKNCRYFRTPVPDPFLHQIKKRTPPNKLKILLLGHLKGVATLSGIALFIKEILPHLEDKLGVDNFEVNLVGGYFKYLPSKLKKSLMHPSIKIRGHISPIDKEFLTSHLLLVPTPIELGIRVRIITSFSFGTPVIAHSANTKGIPELKHDYNCLISSTGEGLADQIIRIYRGNDLQNFISKNSRDTYEKQFSIESAGQEIVKVIQKTSDGIKEK